MLYNADRPMLHRRNAGSYGRSRPGNPGGGLFHGGGQGMTTMFKVQDEVNPRMTLEATGFPGVAQVHYNLLEPALLQAAISRGEGDLGRGGAFLVSTGRHTGRSPKDKFVVREPSAEPHVWWENNAPMAPAAFATLLADMRAHIRGSELFVQDLYAGADPAYRLNVRVVTELAWHGLFIRHLLRRPGAGRAGRFRSRVHHPELPELPCRPGPPRLPFRDRDRYLVRAEADPDRRHRLCRREQEVGVHRAQLPAARARGDADALLGQPRQGRPR